MVGGSSKVDEFEAMDHLKWPRKEGGLLFATWLVKILLNEEKIVKILLNFVLRCVSS